MSMHLRNPGLLVRHILEKFTAEGQIQRTEALIRKTILKIVVKIHRTRRKAIIVILA
jgi:hypothetical protein